MRVTTGVADGDPLLVRRSLTGQIAPRRAAVVCRDLRVILCAPRQRGSATLKLNTSQLSKIDNPS